MQLHQPTPSDHLDHAVKGVKRPKAESGEDKTPALGDHQARQLLAAPNDDSLRSKRDRAILSTAAVPRPAPG